MPYSDTPKTLCEILTVADAMPLSMADSRVDGNLPRHCSVWQSLQLGGGLAYARLAHVDRVHREHPCSRPRIFLPPVCLLEFFPLCFIYVVSENEAIYRVFGLVHFYWNELWRAAIAVSGITVMEAELARHIIQCL